MRYYIDTSFLVAIANQDDKYHKSAILRLQDFKKVDTELITSDYVVDEFLHILMKTEGMRKAILWGDKLRKQQFCSIHHCVEKIFNDALDIFNSEVKERKPMTFTDCVVYCSSTLKSCAEILTYDNRLKSYNN